MDNVTAANFVQRREIATTANYAGNESYYVEDPLGGVRSYVLPTIYSIVCIVGLIGNGLVIYIMHLKVRNINITDLYVLNLAIADFIFVAMLPMWIADIALGRWVFGQVLCKLISGCTYFHMYASVFFLTAMSVDRFLAVVMYQSCRRTKMSATVVVITIWFLSVVLGILPLYFRNVDAESKKCTWTFNLTDSTENSWFLVYVASRSIIGFAIPVVIILVSYSLIIIFLKTRKTRGKLTGKCQDRATKMVLVVIGVFLVCWLPNQISNLLYVIKSLDESYLTLAPDMLHYYIHMFCTCLAWVHSCMNPILYAFMREDMRLKLTEILNHNVKMCCGDTSWMDRQTRSTMKSEINDEPPQNCGGAKSECKLKQDERSKREASTNSFRLTTIHKPSFEENEPLNQNNRESTPWNPPIKEADEAYIYTGDEENVLEEQAALIRSPLTPVQSSAPSYTEAVNLSKDKFTQRSVALIDDAGDGVKTTVENGKADSML